MTIQPDPQHGIQIAPPADGEASRSSKRPVTRPRLRLFIGLALVVLPILGMNIRNLWDWADFNPKPLFILDTIGRFIITPACWFALPIWLLFYSGFRTRTKAVIAGAVLLFMGGAAAAIDEVNFYGALVPTFHYRWQPNSVALLEKHLAEHHSGELPPIDLTVDKVNDFPRYRGWRFDGIAQPNEPLEMTWDDKQPKLLWRQPCGGGFAGFAVAGNVAITIEQRRDEETVVCYDRATGRERWTYAYPASFKHPTGSGPRATPTIAEDGKVYSLGARGLLVCLNGTSGKCDWDRNILEDNEAKAVTWGMTSSPLVLGDLVIVNAGVDPDNNVGRSLVAYNRNTGKRVWGSGTFRAGYSSPQKAHILDRDQVLIFHASGLASFDPKTGRELWQYPWATGMDMNIIQPLVLDKDRVFISSETSNGCAMLKISQHESGLVAEVLWANNNLCAKFANPIARGGAIYGLSDGRMVCLDQRSGKRLWRGPYYGHGQMLAAGGAIVVLTEKGDVVVVAEDKQKFRRLSRMEAVKGRTWNTPALAGRQLFIRNDTEMACFELPLQE